MKANYIRILEIKSQRYSQGGNWITGVGWMSGVTRGQVDNENNIKSIFKHIKYSKGGGPYIMSPESIAIRNRNIAEYGSEHRKVMHTGRETQECYVGTRDRNRTRIGTELELD